MIVQVNAPESAPVTTPRVVVLGASGYTGGELLRLLAGHPSVVLGAALSRSGAGKPITSVHPHLMGVYEGRFEWPESLHHQLEGPSPIVLISCLPHGDSAAILGPLVPRLGGKLRLIIDLAGDFRHPNADVWSKIYGRPHEAAEAIAAFHCGLPELSPGAPSAALAHPGCFATAVTLALAPAQALGLAEPRVAVSAVTGSTGSGAKPSLGTHHPSRVENFRAYTPLVHRHRPEIEGLLERLGPRPEVALVTHSGPFSRGIHVTAHLWLKAPMAEGELLDAYGAYYAGAPFVSVEEGQPRLKAVVGTNRCHLGVAVNGREAVVFSVIDNLTKGAAGGAIHWMNRGLGLADDTGLRLAALGPS